MTLILVDSMVRLSGADDQLLAHCLNENQWPNPEIEQAQRAGRSTWSIPPLVTAWKRDGDQLLLPRGYIRELLTHRPDLKESIVDLRTSELVTIPGMKGITLRNYQQRAVEQMLQKEQGLLESPTGSGKTIMGMELLHRIGERTLLLTHSKELAVQWQREIKKLTGLEAGYIGGGRWKEGEEITIAMLQTLSRRPKETAEIARGYGCTLIEEAHHVPAESFAAVIAAVPTRFRYGLTATPHRRDGLHVLINRNIGATLAKITSKEVEASGGIVPASVSVIETGCRPQSVASWQDFMKEITRNNDRNHLIAIEARKQSDDSPTLVLTDRVEHAKALAEIACDSVLVHGKLPRKEREAAMEAAGSADLTIGTTGLLGEGLDVSRWSSVILATPISSRTKLLQAVGRVLRPHPGKKRGHVIDLVDDCGFSLSSYRKRAVIYRSRGYELNG